MLSRLLVSLILSAVLLRPLAARADDAPLKLDPAARDKLLLLTDGKNHYVAVVPNSSEDNVLFYGDGKRFYSVPVQGYSGQEGKEFSYVFVDPRVPWNGDAREVAWKGKKYTVACGEQKSTLTPVPTETAQPLLAAATFLPSPRKWAAYGLARDNQGRYYYVDHGRTPETAKNFRLWVGPRGNLKQQKMTNVVSDSEGDVFSTKTGSLRLILGRRESSWIVAGKVTPLLVVPVEDNVRMIYTELGVYTGEALGTPCDDL
jgi:hypothetical protein